MVKDQIFSMLTILNFNCPDAGINLFNLETFSRTKPKAVTMTTTKMFDRKCYSILLSLNCKAILSK